MLKEIILP